MAAFKQHCSLGFWNAALLKDPQGVLHVEDKDSRGHFGRITSLKDLPPDKVLLQLLKEASSLLMTGVPKPVAVKKKKAASELPVPDELLKAFKKSRGAQAAFDAFSPSHRKEYIEWITDAKTEATRDKRIATTIEWLIEGKPRHWQYQK